MTNGEKMQEVFPDIEMWGESKDTLDYSLGGMIHRVTKSFWNAEYKEPTTKNCESCRYYGSHHEVCNYCYKCSLWTEVEPTTKNDLGVDLISRADLYNRIKGIDHDEDYECDEFGGSKITYHTCDWDEVLREIEDAPSVTPQLSSELEKNSKKLEKDFGELDCISRADALALFCDKCGLYNCISKCSSYRAVEKMPSVTPQPRKGHWIKGYTFPDGEYWKCDKCNKLIKVKYPMYYCNNCGSDNSREVKE